VKGAAKVLGQRPVYLDTLRLNRSLVLDTPEGRQPVLGYLHDQARERGMRFVPVVWVADSTEAVESIVRCACVADGHGVALRYRALSTLPKSGTCRRALVESQLVRVGCAPDQADLLIDLQYLSEDREILGEDVVELLEEMCAIGSWRSLVLLGTSIPQTLGVIRQGSVGSIERREWRLWCDLERLKPTRMPACGDYAVQHVEPPAESGAGGRASEHPLHGSHGDRDRARARSPHRRRRCAVPRALSAVDRTCRVSPARATAGAMRRSPIARRTSWYLAASRCGAPRAPPTISNTSPTRCGRTRAQSQ
jgi:hypothetical protein